MLPVVLLVIACTRSTRAHRDAIPEAPSSDPRSDSVVFDGVEYDRRELEFMDRSSQGGAIEVNLINNEPALFEVTLFAERGKRTLRVDLRKENQIDLTDQLVSYDRSIYNEGEVQVENRTVTGYVLEDGRLYRSADRLEVIGDPDRVLSLYRDAWDVVRRSTTR
jgi:hypothetical protein